MNFKGGRMSGGIEDVCCMISVHCGEGGKGEQVHVGCVLTF
jgi:hypothetical protein